MTEKRQRNRVCPVNPYSLSVGRDLLKDFSDVKGTLKGWTEKSARWYEEASEYTGYHDALMEYLGRFLLPQDRCCEIACGTGILVRKTAPHVSSCTANDVDETAVSFLKERLQETGMRKVEVLQGPWQEVLAGRCFDVVIASYYGVPVELWDELTKLAGRCFIAICPRSERWKKKHHADGTDLFGGDGITAVRKLETPSVIRAFYESRQIPFESLPLDLEFGQPFSSREEAREYVAYYYRLDGQDADAFLDEKICMKDDGTLYFPKKKEIEMIVADLSEHR